MRRLFIIWVLTLSVRADPYLPAVLRTIALIEGDNPRAHGAAGERTRYQMLRSTWRTYTTVPFSQAETNDALATTVAATHLHFLAVKLRLAHRPVSVYYLALAWTAGINGLSAPPAAKVDYAHRAEQLYPSVLNTMNNLKLYGDRIMLREIPEEEEIEGIFIPSTSQRSYMSLEVVSLGDGRMRGIGDHVTRTMIEVVPGDRVFVQINTMMFANNAQKVDGDRYLTLNQHDVLAKITTGVHTLTLADFVPVGRWVLARVQTPEKVGEIYLPGGGKAAQDLGEVKTYMEKVGREATELGLAYGQRLLLEHPRATPIKLKEDKAMTLFSYIDMAHVVATLDELRISA